MFRKLCIVDDLLQESGYRRLLVKPKQPPGNTNYVASQKNDADAKDCGRKTITCSLSAPALSESVATESRSRKRFAKYLESVPAGPSKCPWFWSRFCDEVYAIQLVPPTSLLVSVGFPLLQFGNPPPISQMTRSHIGHS